MVAHQDRAFEDLRNTVQEYARVFRRRWRLALLGAAIISSIAFWVSQYLPRQYSTATIFERRDDVVLRNLIHRNSPYSFDQLKSSIALDMTGSRALAEAAIAANLLPSSAVTSDQALTNDELRRLDQTLSIHDLQAEVQLVHSSSSLDTIELRCTANNPIIASRFVVALRDGYIQRTRERITEILSGTREFFATEVDRYQQQIKEADQKLKQRFADFPDVDPGNPASVGARLEGLQSVQLRLAQRRAELEAQVEARERFLTSALLTEPAEARVSRSSAPTTPPLLPNTNSAIERDIKQVEQELADAIVLHRMTEEHPSVKALRRKLEVLGAAREATLLQAATASVNPPAQEAVAQRPRVADPVLSGQRLRVELELDALRPQLELSTKHLEEAQARVDRLAALYQRLLESSEEVAQLENQLEQDVTTSTVWRQHLSQLERILAAESEQRGTQFALIEEPKESAHAIKPQVAAIFIVCFGCGLAAAALLIALAELLDRSFRSVGQVTRVLGLPILECIGVIDTPRVHRRRLISRLIWTPALCVLVGSLLASASLAYTSLEHPQLHHRAVSALDGALQTVGAPPTSLAREAEE